MVSRSTTLTVTLTGDASQLSRVLGGANRDLATFERTGDRTGKSLGATFATLRANALLATAGIGAAAYAARGWVDAASGMEEQTSKLRQVFGASADEILRWSDTSAQSMVMSSRAAIEAAGTFGNFTQAMGVSRDSSAAMSMSLVQLAADLASFNDASPEEALTALRSGLVGELEPMRRFGVALNAAAVESKALELGLAATRAELTEGDKVTARYNLIMEQTKMAQGDVARTSGSLANQQRELSAQIDNLKVALGTELLPVMTDVVTRTNDWIQTNGDDFARGFAGAVDVATDAMSGLYGVLQDIRNSSPYEAIVKITDGEGNLITGAILAGLGLKVGGGLGLAAGLGAAAGNVVGGRAAEMNPQDWWETIQEGVRGTFGGIGPLGLLGGETAAQRTERRGQHAATERSLGPEDPASMRDQWGPFMSTDPTRPVSRDNPAVRAARALDELTGSAIGGSEAITGLSGGSRALEDSALRLADAHRSEEMASIAAADATMRHAEALAVAEQRVQQWFASELQSQIGRGTRYAPGVFEGMARLGGMTPLSDLIAGGATITQTDLATGITTPVDIVVP